MDILLAKVLAVTVYKLCSLLTGIFLSYLGYKLFMAGVWGNAGDAEGQFGQNRLIIKKAAPGTFFAVLGAVVIVSTIYQGLKFESLTSGRNILDEKPPLSIS